MKRIVLVVTTVLALVGATYLADKATRVKPKGTVKADGAVVATVAPDFTLKDLDGKDVSLSQYKGKVVLINFWATWCDPSRTKIPSLFPIHQKHPNQALTL